MAGNVIDNNIRQLAKNIGVTPYVIMTVISTNIPRIYIKNGREIARIED